MVKLNIDRMFSLPTREHYGFLVDPQGIILHSTLQDFVLKPLWPVTEKVTRALTQSGQYPPLSEPPVLSARPEPGRLFTFRGTDLQGFQQATSVEGLAFVIFGSMRSWKAARLVGILITLMVSVLVLTFFVIRQKDGESSARVAASKKLYRTLVEGSPNWIGLFDHDGRCLAINGYGLQAMALSEAEVHGKGFNEIWSTSAGPMSEDPVRRVFRGDQVSFESNLVRLKRRSSTWYTMLNPIYETDGKVSAFVAIATDITERKRAEEDKFRLAAIVESSDDAIISKTLDGEILTWNPGAQAIYGYAAEEVVGRSVTILAPDSHRDEMSGILDKIGSGERIENYETIRRRKDGQHIDVSLSVLAIRDLSGRIVGASTIAQDITERKRAEEERIKLQHQLQQARKMESLGRMAGAVAHHFNNKLMAVMGHLDLAFDDIKSQERATARLEQVRRAAEQAVEVSRLMRTYLGQESTESEPLDLAQVCKEELERQENDAQKKTRFMTDAASHGPIITANRAQVELIFKNLFANAAEAIEGKEGNIEVSVRVLPASGLSLRHVFPSDWEPQAGAYAYLEVCDSGCGIQSEDLDQIFDPFFSTKLTGRGLGLAVVLGVVRAHKGAIDVESEPGRGSRFRVFWPILKSEAKPA